MVARLRTATLNLRSKGPVELRSTRGTPRPVLRTGLPRPSGSAFPVLPRKERTRRSAVFLIKFFVIFAVLYLALEATNIAPLQNWLAGFESGLLGIESAGGNVLVQGKPYSITYACTGLVSGILLASIVFALRKPGVRYKIAVSLGGAVLLFVLNLGRLYLVLVLGIMYGIATAEAAHAASWFAVSAAVIALWYYLTKRLCKIKDFGGFL